MIGEPFPKALYERDVDGLYPLNQEKQRRFLILEGKKGEDAGAFALTGKGRDKVRH